MQQRISSGGGLGTLAACAESGGGGKDARGDGGAVPCACGMGPAEDSDARGDGGVALAWVAAGRINDAEGEGEKPVKSAVPRREVLGAGRPRMAISSSWGDQV